MQELLHGLCTVRSMQQWRNSLKCISACIAIVIKKTHFSVCCVGFFWLFVLFCFVYGEDHIEDAYVFLGNDLYGWAHIMDFFAIEFSAHVTQLSPELE